MYACAGAADITNWARAIIVIDPLDKPGLFRFIAAKRAKQIGWKDEFWQPISERYFEHAKDVDAIYWMDVDASALPKAVAKPTILPEDLLQFVPVGAQIHKALLVQDAQQKLGIGVHKADDYLTILVEKGLLEVVQVARKGSRPAIFLKLGTGAPVDTVAAVPPTTAPAINSAVNDGHQQLSLTTVAA